MKTDDIGLCWVVVSNLDDAIEFYTKKLGLKLEEKTAEYGWAELSGHNGIGRLGLAQANAHMPAGQNAVATFTVADIDQAIAHAKETGVNLVGDVIEVPGHVKMQTVVDGDGNTFQFVQKLD